MSVFLFGATSMNGWSVVQRYADRLTAFCNPYIRNKACEGWRRLRLEDEAALRALFDQQAPKLLIHCGGICDVDKCEDQPDFAQLLNVRSVSLLLRYLPPSTRLVYCSSDHVFGAGGQPHFEAAPTRPITVYGGTRVQAEQMIRERRPRSLVIRSGLGIGPSIAGKTGHLDWLRYRHTKHLPMTVVEDETRSAVWATDLADRIWRLAHSNITGTRHVVATTSVSRLDLARHLCERYHIPADIRVERRADREVPHLGDVTLATSYTDELAAPLVSVMDHTG